MDLSDFTLYSGGAIGADYYWGYIGKKYGVNIKHYYINRTPYGNVKLVLDKNKIFDVDNLLNIVNDKYIHRKYPTSKEYINNLLRRNYFQVDNTKAVYAISTFDNNGIVSGGTAWAVYMAIELGVKYIFIFDQIENKLYQYENNKFTTIDKEVRLVKRFTGIGTRNLNVNGKLFIENIYKNTIKHKEEKYEKQTN